MRILFVCSGNGKINTGNGISPFIRSQGESLKQNGIDLDFFPIKGKGMKQYSRHIFILKKFLKKNKYDIIHAHYGLCGIVAYFAARREPLVVSFMGDDLVGENRLDGSYTWIGNLLVSLNKWFAGKKFKTVIVKSAQMQKILGSTNSIVLPNGVDFKRFYPMDKHDAREQLGIPQEERMILFVGDPRRPEKNFSLAEHAAALLPGKSYNLRIIQGVPHDSLNRYYNAADACLLTSFHEGSPNVIKEAMACNCPIVSTDVGDVRQVIGNTAGCYISSFDPGDVAEKLKLALASGQRTNGRDNIRHLESGIIAEKLIDIYQNLVSREDSRRNTRKKCVESVV
ncbi:MAG: glycosyltransferase family 4 protein [Acidobacteria bacterium]|jgi:glycosyltransferase involved in cell wall biosynthesis|nr:glycosyltransferase family 4 protein [Acidobacteriota bacterium]